MGSENYEDALNAFGAIKGHLIVPMVFLSSLTGLCRTRSGVFVAPGLPR
jgi:hypothetical protein